MSLHVTPHMLEAMYEFFRASTPMFRKLPPADDVEFVVLATVNVCGHFRGGLKGAPSEIGISTGRTGSLLRLAETVSHEMIHFKQDAERTFTPNSEHNAEFHRLARIVCRQHVFDYKAFV